MRLTLPRLANMTFDEMETVRKMKQIVPEYKSNNSVYEVLDGEKGNCDKRRL